MLRCHFRHSGFSKGDKRFRPCGVVYHPACFRVATPFRSRRDDDLGLRFPDNCCPGLFVCEACTVRSVLERELRTATDIQLMTLERMRVLDIAHSWAPGSYRTYRPYLRAVQRFEKAWGVGILQTSVLRVPPSDPVITLMWCHEAYGLRTGRRTGSTEQQVTFSTVRQLRAAVAQWETWNTLITDPGNHYFDQNRRLLKQECRPTDDAAFTAFAKGLSIRTGTESNPSKSLLFRHIQYLDQHLEARYHLELDPYLAHELALAGTFNATTWLGWLRSSETLGLRWADASTVEPPEGPTLDLEVGTGAVLLRLRAETKSQRSVRAEMILAYTSGAGIRLGRWLRRARVTCPIHGIDTRRGHQPIFVHPDQTPWTSLYFRERYLYPALHRQRAGGDPWLVPFGQPGTLSLEEAFWSLSSYRNGARSWVSRRRVYGPLIQRKATAEEVYEHGRWRRQRNAEPIDKIYQQWTYADRIAITLQCM